MTCTLEPFRGQPLPSLLACILGMEPPNPKPKASTALTPKPSQTVQNVRCGRVRGGPQ
jgi:hypothetical protein